MQRETHRHTDAGNSLHSMYGRVLDRRDDRETRTSSGPTLRTILF